MDCFRDYQRFSSSQARNASIDDADGRHLWMMNCIDTTGGTC